MVIYFSDEFDLEHRTMVYDNCVTTIHAFLAHSKDQEPQPGDRFSLPAAMIARSEKIAYQKRHWPEGSPVSEPLAITGEIDKILGSVATTNTIMAPENQTNSSSSKADELAFVNIN